MTYTTLKNEDQNNSPWVPRALTAVGLGALAFASGTLYRNSSNNDVVVATTLVRGGGGGGENKVFTLEDIGPSETCPFQEEVNLDPRCVCAQDNCKQKFKDCREDTACKRKIKKCLNKEDCDDDWKDCVDQTLNKDGVTAKLQGCLQQNCENC